MRALANNAPMQREFRRQAFPDLNEAGLEKLVENSIHIAPHNIVALIAAWSRGDSAGASPGPSDIPVLIVGGANDTVCTPEVLESLVVPRFAMGKMVLLPHAGHWPHIDYPGEIAREIEKFIESTGRE